FRHATSPPEEHASSTKGKRPLSLAQRAELVCVLPRKRLALGGGLFDGLVLLGRPFFLFFFLEFVVYEFKDSDFGAVADPNAGMDDAGVAARAIGELRRDLAEQLFCDAGRHDVSRSQTP